MPVCCKRLRPQKYWSCCFLTSGPQTCDFFSRREKEESERKAKEENEKKRLELEEKLRREEEERLARKKRIEEIMARTRGPKTSTVQPPTTSLPASNANNLAEKNNVRLLCT